MALAVIKTVKMTGSSPGTSNDLTGGKAGLLSADVHTTNPSQYPIPVPKEVTDPDVYSYECKLRIELTSAPANYVNTIKIYGPSTRPNNDPNVTLYLGTTGTYSAPVNSQSSVATVSVHDNYYSEGTALSIGGTLNDVGDQSEDIVFQLKVANGALKGSLPLQTCRYTYNEA